MYHLPTNLDPEAACEVKKLQDEYIKGLRSDAPFAMLKTIRLKIKHIISSSVTAPYNGYTTPPLANQVNSAS